MRACLDRDDKLISRFKLQAFPSFRILSDDGKVVLGGVPLKTAADLENPKPFLDACAGAKKALDDFKEKVKSADLKKPEDRLDLISLYAQQPWLDDEKATKLFEGWDEKDNSLAHAKAIVALGRFKLMRQKLDEVEKTVLKDADRITEALLKDEKQKADAVPVLADIWSVKINKAAMEKNKALALKLLDEAAQKFPESRLAKDHDTIKTKIESSLP